MRDRVRHLVVLTSIMALPAAGCATREWVNEVVAQRDAEMAQRVNRVEAQVTQGSQRTGQIEGRVGAIEGRVTGTEGRVSQEGQRLDAVAGQVKGLEASVGQVDQRARGAQDRADTAMTRANSVESRLGRLWSNRYGNRLAGTVDVYFPVGRADLAGPAHDELLQVVRELQAHSTLTVELHGFTDPSGAREYNYQLSQRRIDAVRRFLAQQGVPPGRIQSVVQGPIADPHVPAEKKRRVTVKLMVDPD